MARWSPWVLVALLVAAVAASELSRSAAQRDADVERGRVEELIRLRNLAEQEAAQARLEAMSWGDSVVVARQREEQRRRDAERRAESARQAASDAESALRATLDSLDVSTGHLETLLMAHSEELGAKDEIIEAQEVRIAALETYAESMVRALDAADVKYAALEAERDSYRRQVELLSRPPRLKRAGQAAGLLAIGFALGSI